MYIIGDADTFYLSILIVISGLAFASRFLMCLYCQLYTWCEYGSLI